MKKKILFLIGDIWDLGKNKGMPSIFNMLVQADEKFNCTIFTTDSENFEQELPNSNIMKIKKHALTSKNRYIDYLIARAKFLHANLSYIYEGLKLQDKPEIIYCSSSFPVLAAWVLKKYFKAKLIHRIYGTYLYSSLASLINKYKKAEEVLVFKLKADKYIITNDGTHGDKVAAYFGITSEKIAFLRNGVNKTQIYNCLEAKKNIIEELRLSQDSFLVLSVSRLVNWKRVDRTIRAMNIINNPKIVFLVIGDGPMMEEYKELSQNGNIKFLGAKERNEVQKYMQGVDLFISMYDFSNVGNPLLEALTAGLPIITYDSGDTQTIINGTNGILIRCENEEEVVIELKNNMLELYENTYKRKMLANNAQKYADENLLSWDERIAIEIKIIEEMV